MEPMEGVLLVAAAFGAGAVNAVAGGGSLISFPALMAAGYPAKAANVTNAVALWPGYLAGTVAYRRELAGQGKRALAMLVPSIAGALLGSAILIGTPEAAFRAVVPFLILFACGLMAFQRPIADFSTSHRLGAQSAEHVPWTLWLSVFGMSVYGGYFGAGLGIMMLSVLAILLPDDLHRCNALKGLLSFVVNGVAVVYFSAFGPVEWAPALLMMAGAIAGGYLGVGAVRHIPPHWLRGLVVVYGVVVAAVLFVE